jgi:cytochrome d ubiquinol oxidase subunit II
MHLTTVWFLLIAVLWGGYFFLEGFDFGVGILLPVLGRHPDDRMAMLRSIGPLWDGNEVWVLVAGGATFAAFPEWYATLFSGFYLALLLILLGLILRGTAIEYRNKSEDAAWRRRWDVCIFIGSAVPALLWGVAFANIVHGVPINSSHQFTGNLLTLLHPYALLGGLVTLSLFTLHGALFLALKTDGNVRHAARRFAGKLGVVAVVLAAAFLIWTQVDSGKAATDVTAVLAAVALIGALFANLKGREGWAFAAMGLVLLLAVGTLFGNLWPNVMPSTTNTAFNLTVRNASSSPYTLGVMSWVALFATPIVLLYEGWSYWVFRKRVTGNVATVVTTGSA